MLDPENKLEGVVRSKGFMWYASLSLAPLTHAWL
jgi:hypothetical protein